MPRPDRPDYDHNLETSCPPVIKAKITAYGRAMRDYAWKGAQPPEDQEAIEEALKLARYDLERTILTVLQNQQKGATS